MAHTHRDAARLPVDVMYSFMLDVLTAAGVPADDAKTCADVLIASDLRGIESHGIGRLKMYIDRIKTGQQKAVTQLEVVRETPATALVDGHHGMGMVIAKRSMQMAIDKAKAVGMGSVAVRNSTHFGIDGYYPRMAAEQGCVGMAFTNARPSIAPTFSVQPMLGTNPIAFCAPTDEECPFLFDAATSITQRGKFEVYERESIPSPEGWAVDQSGRPVTDSAAVLKGLGDDTVALLPLGGAGEILAGYKGYGLATIVEILSASLQMGQFMHGLNGFEADGSKRPFMLGHYFMAINIEAFVSLDEFKKTTGDILRELRAARREPGQDRIYTAGEKEFENEKRIRVEGIPVVPALQKDMLALIKDLNLTQYHFDF